MAMPLSQGQLRDHRLFQLWCTGILNDRYQVSRLSSCRIWGRSLLKCFTIYGHGGHLGHVTQTAWTNFCSCHLGRLSKNKCRLFLIRVAGWPPIWEIAVHSVYCACLSWTFFNLCKCCFPFWFWGWDVGFDCVSSWSLPCFLLSTWYLASISPVT